MQPVLNFVSVEGQDINRFCKSLLKGAEKSDCNRILFNIANVPVDSKNINIFRGHSRVMCKNIIDNSKYLDKQD